MGIYKNSRYTSTSLQDRDGKSIFKIRERMYFSLENARAYEFTEGDTLDGLAYSYYGDSQLWWVILEANKQYKTPLEINHGDRKSVV